MKTRWQVPVFTFLAVSLALLGSGWAAAPDESQLRKAEELQRDAVRLREEEKYHDATRLNERACSILKAELGRKSLEAAACLNDLGRLYREQGEYEKAKTSHEQALTIREKVLGTEHPDVATTLNDLGALFYDQGKYEKAVGVLERALAIREVTLAPNHPDVATNLNDLGTINVVLGEYAKAEPLLERALLIREKALRPDHPDLAESLGNLAVLYREQGRNDKRDLLLRRALAINEKALGPNHPMVARSLNNLAGFFSDQGKWEKAEPLQERALSIVETALGEEHPYVAVCLFNLAWLYQLQGEYEKAEPLHERALVMRERTLGPNHPIVARNLIDLAGLHWQRGENSKGKPLAERALSIYENALGPEHPEVARALTNLAMLHASLGENKMAEALLWRALAIAEKMNPDHHSLAIILNNLGMLYMGLGQFEKAEPLLTRALASVEKNLGHEHPTFAAQLETHAWLHVQLGRADAAVTYFRRALTIQDENVSQNLVFAEENRRLSFAAAVYRNSTAGVLTAHLQAAPDHAASAELALTTLLRRKVGILDLGTRSADAIRRSLPEEHQHLLEELAATRGRYAHLTSQGPEPHDTEAFAKEIAEIREDQHRLWRELSRHSPVASALSIPITIADVQRALPRDALLVEFVRYHPHHHEKSPWAPTEPRYAAYLVFHDRFDWVDLGPSNPIDQRITAFRSALQLKQGIPSDLYEAVMQPVVDRLGSDVHQLYIAPDDTLNLVPFAALYDSKRYLIERFTLHYLTTGRDLLRPWDSATSTSETVVVVANPTGANLPGTEHEARLLEELFPHVQPFLHQAATATGLRRNARPWVLHLGTHGFFGNPEPDRELDAKVATYLSSMSPTAMPFAQRRLDNPMLHSGLLLTSDATNDDTADGRLTAYEISGWDLRGTELVVLSACGTGLGELRAGEGVLGLRRAFAMAGAQTQVMSLWDVPDSMTARLMEAYYRKLLEGKGRAEAMQEVQLEMLRSEEHHPGDWASFVVVGEWRPLSAEKLPEQPPAIDQGRGCHRASVAGAAEPPPMLLFGLLALLMPRRCQRDLNATGVLENDEVSR